MSKENQQKQQRIMTETENYDYNNTNGPSMVDQNMGEYAHVSASQPPPSHSRMENDPSKQSQKQANPTPPRHKRGVSSSDIHNVSGSSSNAEAMDQDFSSDEPNLPTNYQTDNKRSKNKYNNGFYNQSARPPLYKHHASPKHYRGNNPYLQDSSSLYMSVPIEQLPIQDVYAIIEENRLLHMEKMELRRRLAHVTARANYLEGLKSAADATKPYSDYNKRSNTNKGKQQQQQQQQQQDNNGTTDDEQISAPASTMEHDASQSPDVYHYSETSSNNNNSNHNKERRTSFDYDYSPQYHQRGFYRHQYDMADNSPYGRMPPPPPPPHPHTPRMPPYMMSGHMFSGPPPPPPPPPLSTDNSTRSSGGYDRMMHSRHYFDIPPYNRGFSDEGEDEGELDLHHSDGNMAAMEDEAMVAAMNGFYHRSNNAQYGPSMHPPPPPPPPPGAFMSGPPYPGMMPMYGRQQGPPPPPPPPQQPWMMNDLSPYPESLPRSRRPSVHRRTKSNSKSHKVSTPVDIECEEMLCQLAAEEEEQFQMMMHRMSINGPPPPPRMHMYGGDMVPLHPHPMGHHPNMQFTSGNGGGGGGSLRRVSKP